MAIATRTDAGGGDDWRIDDDLIHLRAWGTDVIYPLPAGDAEWTIGAAHDCWLHLVDPSGRVSRHHAKLSRADGHWVIADDQSKNGIREDGGRRGHFLLAPGLEVGIGGVTLIVESPRFVALRELLSRLIGWAHERRTDVDLALRAVRTAATRRESLLLCGEGDLISLAQLLHRHTHGDARPFVVCDPRRRRTDPNVRTAANYDSGLVALAAAAGGTLCIWQNRQPDDFAEVVASVREPTSRVQLVVCTHSLPQAAPLIASPIVLPRLADRAPELDRIIDAFGADAVEVYGGVFTPADRAWVSRHESATLPEIERATRRLVAIRGVAGSITRAANQLGMSHGALSEWVARRALPE
jgi:hypothetical protein